MIKTIKTTVLTFNITISMWLVLSYVEIVIKNLNTPIYSHYNLILILFRAFDNLLKGGIF